jgi:hypothetical protein
MRSWTLAFGTGFSLIALAIGGLARAASTEVTVHVFQFRRAFLASASPNLPKSVVADPVKHHVVTLKSVVDAQTTRDYTTAYANERTTVGHMQQIADPLAAAIVQFPDRYRG